MLSEKDQFCSSHQNLDSRKFVTSAFHIVFYRISINLFAKALSMFSSIKVSIENPEFLKDDLVEKLLFLVF